MTTSPFVPGPPNPDEYAPFYADYVQRQIGTDVLLRLPEQSAEVERRFAAVPPQREGWRYAEGKWSVRQVLGHMIDAERVFGYRAMCIARGESKPLPGFDEDEYVANAPFEHLAVADLLPEFLAVRAGHVLLFSHLSAADWSRRGNANGQPVSVRALPYIMAGHVHHHLEILATRYGA